MVVLNLPLVSFIVHTDGFIFGHLGHRTATNLTGKAWKQWLHWTILLSNPNHSGFGLFNHAGPSPSSPTNRRLRVIPSFGLRSSLMASISPFVVRRSFSCQTLCESETRFPTTVRRQSEF